MIYTTEIRDGATGLLVERDVYDTTAGTCTTYGPSGQQVSQRALTTTEAAALAAADTATTSSANQATILQAKTALTANAADKTQDANIITQAASVIASPPTTLAAMTPVIKALAQAVTVLAQNDQNTKAELNTLIRLAVQDFTATT